MQRLRLRRLRQYRQDPRGGRAEAEARAQSARLRPLRLFRSVRGWALPSVRRLFRNVVTHMSKRFTLTVRRNGVTLMRLRFPSLSAVLRMARLYAADGLSVRIRPALSR
jgi:hypothetical protein